MTRLNLASWITIPAASGRDFLYLNRMKEILFRPLRRIKKTNKITVASYVQWRKVKTADYNKFNLTVNDEYKMFPKEEYVYDHKGGLIFFFTYNPADIMIFQRTLIDEVDFDFDEARSVYRDFIIHNDGGKYGSPWTSYFMRGTDCDGVPTFSHWDENRVTQEDCWNYFGSDQFEPLTVDTVLKWFGWFLYQLENSYLKIGR